ncbi:hypothetical protein EDB81DRAFT_792882 [Dactylonectria macrodidyma]|uniref:Uncharacterized protein n=1 Tax=Dactylonectria macrodidyma TaxID=307937 RepID=A0A9P9EY73_9HYPO|nr:hypothetical protein EDB81DRAFT_792882 [Dactylonectria macrodidyma]
MLVPLAARLRVPVVCLASPLAARPPIRFARQMRPPHRYPDLKPEMIDAVLCEAMQGSSGFIDRIAPMLQIWNRPK